MPPQKTKKQVKEFNKPKENFSKSPKENNNYFVFLFISAGVLVVIFGLLVYFFQQNKINQQNKTVHQVLDGLKSEIEFLKDNLDQVSEDDQNDSLVYRNDKYGFTFTLPESWKGYMSKKIENDFNGKVLNTIAFGFSDATEVLYINIYTREQWKEQNKEGNIVPRLLGENNVYIFALNVANDAHPYLNIMADSSQSIVDTFDAYDIAVSNSVWQNYKNNTLGFSLNIPKDAEVIENGDVVFIYQNTDDSVSSRINEEYLNKINSNENSRKKSQGVPWAILVQSIENDNDLNQFIQERYGSGCSLGDKTPSEQIGVYDIAIKTDGKDPGESKCFINHMTNIRYYPDKNIVAAWDIGQAYNFVIDGSGVDGYMTDSFKFLN